ncbi:hypothetical protein [Rhodococcus artemisiae]|uniref:Uncharacterized protein n=1 Tax=Rhodococcus artemisiae TaxID=714159 RepID=A0ABU7L3G3_9NOCA|nr:hypothetical protein [Rhodococcus artemisiae]MEE2056028.1 hypothetical protein [Rhodococcus artemisiae]
MTLGDHEQNLVWQAEDAVDDVYPGDWVTAALPRFDCTVGSLVPPIFPADTQILHPAMHIATGSGEQMPVRWAEVAAATGAVIHPTVEWFSLLYNGTNGGVGDGRGTVWDDAVRALDSWGPNLWWPQDRAWFAAADIDLMPTYIGSSTDCARALHACPPVETIDTTATNRVAWDSDDINPLPQNPYKRSQQSSTGDAP